MLHDTVEQSFYFKLVFREGMFYFIWVFIMVSIVKFSSKNLFRLWKEFESIFLFNQRANYDRGLLSPRKANIKNRRFLLPGKTVDIKGT